MQLVWIRVEAVEMVRHGWILGISEDRTNKMSSQIRYGVWREESEVNDYTKISGLNPSKDSSF